MTAAARTERAEQVYYQLPPAEPAICRIGADVLVTDYPRRPDMVGESGTVRGWTILLSGVRVYYVELSTGERIDCLASDLVAVET